MIRSLVAKFTLAFLIVGVVGALLVALFMRQQTESAWDRFMFDPQRLTPTLSGYYDATGDWEGVDLLLAAQNSAPQRPHLATAVVDTNGVIRYAEGEFEAGSLVPDAQLDAATPITVNGELVGWLLIGQDMPVLDEPPPDKIDDGFTGDLTRATLWSVLIAILIALFLGTGLARSLVRPIKELTRATLRMSDGDLAQQVHVHSRDEIGILANSFNKMSRDISRLTEARRQMTADVAHDLRTPITVLRGYTEALRTGTLQGSPELFAILDDEVLRLNHLVDDLRTISLADAGELPLKPQVVDTLALLERTGLMYVTVAEQKGVALKIESMSQLPAVELDPDRMTQVLDNLVENALRHTPSGGAITLKAQKVMEDEFQLLVTDNGDGIADEHLQHIFDRFYRVDKSRNRVDSSSGLGLAITKSIVEAHRGTIAVESHAGRGTSFIITLPLGGDAPIGTSGTALSLS